MKNLIIGIVVSFMFTNAASALELTNPKETIIYATGLDEEMYGTYYLEHFEGKANFYYEYVKPCNDNFFKSNNTCVASISRLVISKPKDEIQNVLKLQKTDVYDEHYPYGFYYIIQMSNDLKNLNSISYNDEHGYLNVYTQNGYHFIYRNQETYDYSRNINDNFADLFFVNPHFQFTSQQKKQLHSLKIYSLESLLMYNSGLNKYDGIFRSINSFENDLSFMPIDLKKTPLFIFDKDKKYYKKNNEKFNIDYFFSPSFLMKLEPQKGFNLYLLGGSNLGGVPQYFLLSFDGSYHLIDKLFIITSGELNPGMFSRKIRIENDYIVIRDKSEYLPPYEDDDKYGIDHIHFIRHYNLDDNGFFRLIDEDKGK